MFKLQTVLTVGVLVTFTNCSGGTPSSKAASAALDTTPPKTPQSGAAAAHVCGAIDLSWYAGVDSEGPDDTGLDHYEVLDSTGNVIWSGTGALPEGISWNYTSDRFVRIGNLSPGTSYQFSIRSVDRAGISSQIAVLPAVTTAASDSVLCTDKTKPSTPDISTLTVKTPSCRRFDVSFSSSTDKESGVAGYFWLLDGRPFAYSSEQNYALGGLVPGKTYALSFVAVDNAGNLSDVSGTYNLTMPHCSDVPIAGEYPVAMVPVYFQGEPLPTFGAWVAEEIVLGSTGVNPYNTDAFIRESSFGNAWLGKGLSSDWLELSGTPEDYGCLRLADGRLSSCDGGKRLIEKDVRDNFAGALDNYPILLVFVDRLAGGAMGGLGIVISIDDPVNVDWSSQANGVAHEVGHFFGLMHAGELACPGPGYGDQSIPRNLSDPRFGCQVWTYGDPWDVMGGYFKHPSALQKYWMNWITEDQVAWVDGPHTGELAPSDQASSGDTKLLLVTLDDANGFGSVNDGFPAYAVEYVSGVGFNGAAGGQPIMTPGLYLRYTGSNGLSRLWLDHAIAGRVTNAGEAFVDPYRGIQIELVSITPAADGGVPHAQVRIDRFNDFTSNYGLPVVETERATAVTASYARMGVTVIDDGNSPVTECGVCWGPNQDVSFVATQELGPAGQRCMRQIPCLGAAYYTGDGFMDQREYAGGAVYHYRAYAMNAAGIGYGWLYAIMTPGPTTYELNSQSFSTYAQLWGRWSQGDPPGLSECGICWGTEDNPTLVDQSSNAPGDSVRCMRSFGCGINRSGEGGAGFWFSTRDGYQTQIDYLPGVTYNYRAYGVVNGEVQYGKKAHFVTPPTMVTGVADQFNGAHARLAGSVESYGPVAECGVCWGFFSPAFVDSQQLGPNRQRCMRQIGCGNRSYAYYTDDGFMDQLSYAVGGTYQYMAYARTNDGHVYYGEMKSFVAQ